MKRKKPAVFLIRKRPLRLAVLISGQGSTLQSLLDNQTCNIKFVVSDKNALGLKKAQRFGVETLNLEKKFSALRNFSDSQRKTENFLIWQQLQEELIKRKIDAIILCGFMRILPSYFVSQWENKIINVHPSLLPLYAGKEGIAMALKYGGPYGVSLHTVTADVDAGALLLQRNFSLDPIVLVQSESANRQQDLQDQVAIHRMQYANAEQSLLREFCQRWS